MNTLFGLRDIGVGGGTGYFSWVHLDDAASATVLAVEQQAKGVFNIVDDEPAPASQWLPYLAACAGAKPPMRAPAALSGTPIVRSRSGSTGMTMPKPIASMSRVMKMKISGLRPTLAGATAALCAAVLFYLELHQHVDAAPRELEMAR